MADIIEKMNRLLGITNMTPAKKKTVNGNTDGKRKYTFHRDTDGRKRKRPVK